jgi:hypothetical protein
MAKRNLERALMKKLKLVMVGNGMAGVRTLEELLKIAPDIYDITVFGALNLTQTTTAFCCPLCWPESKLSGTSC